MKLLMGERVKNRVVGLAVIISIAAIFVPAIMKKSGQRFDKRLYVENQFPPKPTLPVVTIPQKDVLFQKMKVAQVSLPAVANRPSIRIITAKSLRAQRLASAKTQLASVPRFHQPLQPSVMVKMPRLVQKRLVRIKNVPQYRVQLAVFSRQKNAKRLVNQLKNKGYKAQYTLINKPHHRHGYQVTVGAVKNPKEAVALKKQLALHMRMDGFVVPTRGVS